MICEQIDYPLPLDRDIRIDYHAVGKLYQSQGRKDEAKQILTALADENYITPELVYDLGLLHKKDKLWQEATEYFRQGADLMHAPSMLELCIMLEQKHKDYAQALAIAEALSFNLLSDPVTNTKKLIELEKRIARLKNKMGKPKKEKNTKYTKEK
jgi:lipopolysaccharide biosynthesis regulator YciM